MSGFSFAIDEVNNIMYYSYKSGTTTTTYYFKSLDLLTGISTTIKSSTSTNSVVYEIVNSDDLVFSDGKIYYGASGSPYADDIYMSDITAETQTKINYGLGFTSQNYLKIIGIIGNVLFSINDTWSTGNYREFRLLGINVDTGTVVVNTLLNLSSTTDQINSRSECFYKVAGIVDNTIYLWYAHHPYGTSSTNYDTYLKKIVISGTTASYSTVKNYGYINKDYISDDRAGFIEPLNHFVVNVTSGAVMGIYTLVSKIYEHDKTVIITRSDNNTGLRKTELCTPDLTDIQKLSFGRLEIGFNDAYYFYSGSVRSLPAYYGTGTEWIKFKN